MNHKLGYVNVMKDHRRVPYVETNLIDLDDPSNSEATSIDPKEVCSKIEVLKKWVAKEEAKCAHLEKEREQDTLNTIIERDKLLRRMVSLKEKNKKIRRKDLIPSC